MSLRPLTLGLAVASLTGCPKQELATPQFPVGAQEQPIELTPPLEAETGEVTDRFQTFLGELSKSEGHVGPMTSEIQSFSEGEVTQGMLARYRSFSDQWWDYVHEFNQARPEGVSLVIPAEPTEDPIFTEMIVPIVRGMDIDPAERRAVLEDYRYRTLIGLRNDMEGLFETGLKPIVDGTLAFSDLGLGESRLYASCIVDGCESQIAGHTLPVDFFEQLARENIASSWDTTAVE